MSYSPAPLLAQQPDPLWLALVGALSVCIYLLTGGFWATIFHRRWSLGYCACQVFGAALGLTTAVARKPRVRQCLVSR